jgi:phosphate-selective porin OprO/OprP
LKPYSAALVPKLGQLRQMLMSRWVQICALILIATAAVRAETPPANADSKPKVEIGAPIEDVKTEKPTGECAEVFAPSQHPIADLLKPTFELRGRIQTDAIVAVQSPESIAVIGDLQNGFGFRRVRLGAQGTIHESTLWVSEVELAGGNVQLRDVYVGITALPWVREFRAGHLREPFSLEGMTSSNFITFMERSPLNQLDPTRNWGIAGLWWPDDRRLLLEMGLFRDGTNQGGQSIGDGDNWAVTGRLTGLPVYEPEGVEFALVHLGMAASFRSPLDGEVNFAPGFQSNLLTVQDNPMSPFLPAVVIPANSVQELNLQFATVRGPFSTQAEWFGDFIQQTDAGMVFLHGFYFDASYFLTGEHRGYDLGRGAFDKVTVLRPLIKSPGCHVSGWGAWEVAARFALANFDSPNMPPAMDGGSAAAILYQLTLGTNWYLNTNTRFMFNYTLGIPDQVGQPQVAASLFSARLAIYW